MLLIADQPDARLRDLADALGVTERTAYGIVVDLTDAGYVVKKKVGRRNHYEIRKHLPLPGAASENPTVGELLDLLSDSRPGRPRGRALPGRKSPR